MYRPSDRHDIKAAAPPSPPADTRLRQVLAPTCGATIDNPVNPPTGSGPISGHGGCYDYLAEPATVVRGGIWLFHDWTRCPACCVPRRRR
ncbi:hypothetical protein [Actinoplanes sp. NPDC049265]|uniref:hypothetical protein n=1 Tax=Actinoplanes sp. NPDC049265 TaxID=3363902 RepID=UPI0037215EC3